MEFSQWEATLGPAGPPPSKLNRDWTPKVGELIYCCLTREEAADIWALFHKQAHRVPAIVTDVLNYSPYVVCECVWDRRLEYSRSRHWVAPISPLEALAASAEDCCEERL